MALPKRTLPKVKAESKSKIPVLCWCKNCGNGGVVEDFKVWCTIKGIWQHSVVSCPTYK